MTRIGGQERCHENNVTLMCTPWHVILRKNSIPPLARRCRSLRAADSTPESSQVHGTSEGFSLSEVVQTVRSLQSNFVNDLLDETP